MELLLKVHKPLPRFRAGLLTQLIIFSVFASTCFSSDYKCRTSNCNLSSDCGYFIFGFFVSCGLSYLWLAYSSVGFWYCCFSSRDNTFCASFFLNHSVVVPFFFKYMEYTEVYGSVEHLVIFQFFACVRM